MKIDDELKQQIYKNSGITQESLLNSYQQQQTDWQNKEAQKLNRMKWVMWSLWIIIILNFLILLIVFKLEYPYTFDGEEARVAQGLFLFISQILGILPIFAVISTILYFSRRYFFNRKMQQNQIATSLQNIEKLLMEMREEQRKSK